MFTLRSIFWYRIRRIGRERNGMKRNWILQDLPSSSGPHGDDYLFCSCFQKQIRSCCPCRESFVLILSLWYGHGIARNARRNGKPYPRVCHRRVCGHAGGKRPRTCLGPPPTRTETFRVQGLRSRGERVGSLKIKCLIPGPRRVNKIEHVVFRWFPNILVFFFSTFCLSFFDQIRFPTAAGLLSMFFF